MGKFGTFSFHGSKTLTTGEGGMFVTNDVNLYERVLILSNHGRSRDQKRQFWPDMVGFKYKMSNIQAAIGCAQMERIEELLKRKREILATYKNELTCLPGVTMNPEPLGTTNGGWMPTIVFSRETGVTRDKLQAAFAGENIDARVFFWALSGMDCFKTLKKNKNSWDIPNRAINIPSYHEIKADQIKRVIDIIYKVYYD